MRHLICLWLSLVSISAFAQSEQILKQELEGKRVEVLIEMPATKEGIDIHVFNPNPMDFNEYSRDLKKHGIALFPGDVVMITKIKKKGKHIEFQLAGGGYGTFGDDSGNVHSSRIPKSAREDEIEKILKDKSDEANRKDLQKELDRLRKERRIEQERLDREAEIASAVKQERIQSLKLQAGSRFNIRLDRNVESGDLHTEQIIKYLNGYVNFSPGTTISDPSIQTAGTLSKGLSWNQVSHLFGAPQSMSRNNDCGLEIMTCSFEKEGMMYEITFVEEIVVKYSIHSK